MSHHHSIPALIAALQDKSSGVRQRAAQFLGDIGAAQAVPALIEALLNDPHEWVRTDAAAALGKIGDQRAVPALLITLKSEQLIEQVERELEATRSMAEGDARSEKKLFLWETLTAAISDLRAAAATALGQIGGPEAVSGLTEALQEKRDSNVRQAAQSALQELQ